MKNDPNHPFNIAYEKAKIRNPHGNITMKSIDVPESEILDLDEVEDMRLMCGVDAMIIYRTAGTVTRFELMDF